MNGEIRCITNKGKTAKNERENNVSNFLRALYSVYKKVRTILFTYFPLTCLNKDVSVLLKVVNTWTSFKYKKQCS